MKKQIGTYYENNEADKMVFKLIRLDAELSLELAKILEDCSDEDFDKRVLERFNAVASLVLSIRTLEDQIFAKKKDWKIVRHPMFVDRIKYALDSILANMRPLISFTSIVDKRGDMAGKYLERGLCRSSLTSWKWLNIERCEELEKMITTYLEGKG
jgi:hypothetical protein